MTSELTGISYISNGNHLRYPWKVCFESLARNCDQAIFNYDNNSEDGSQFDVWDIQDKYWNVSSIGREWRMGINTGNGSELARQANEILPYVTTEWILYLQGDELLHDSDYAKLRYYLDNVPSNVSQIELFRTYFWNLDYRLVKDELFLGRVFRNGTHTIGGDGMFLIRNSGEVFRTRIPIYHYSRVGDEKDITARVRTLDRLFHDEEKVQMFKDFAYTNATQEELIPFSGEHPQGILEFYRSQR